MQTISDLPGLSSLMSEWRSQGLTIGVVPTMGGLHEGHLALVRESVRVCDRTLVTIFVNPLQFGVNEDFDSYPRQEEKDKEALSHLRCDAVFMPTTKSFFPQDLKTFVEVKGISHLLCGKSRPGHFAGVTTELCRLFGYLPSSRIFMGEKDFQQLVIVKKMVDDLNLPVRIVPVPTQRAQSGLALSSRNSYLSEEELVQASFIYKTLAEARIKICKNRENVKDVIRWGTDKIIQSGLTSVDYFCLCSGETLEKSYDPLPNNRLFCAAYIRNVRLIDNLPLFSNE